MLPLPNMFTITHSLSSRSESEGMICGEVGRGEPSSVTIWAWKVSAVAVAVPASAAVTARMPTRSAEFVLMMFPTCHYMLRFQPRRCLEHLARSAAFGLNSNQMADASIQTALAVGVPTLAVLVGILVNNSRRNDLRGHMDARFDDMREM